MNLQRKSENGKRLETQSNCYRPKRTGKPVNWPCKKAYALSLIDARKENTVPPTVVTLMFATTVLLTA
jgi:hypothetical protein